MSIKQRLASLNIFKCLRHIFMEYFGFASWSSRTGPAFPSLPESILDTYPKSLLDHPALPTLATSFLNIEVPDSIYILEAFQTCLDKSVILLEKPEVKTVGVGLSATVCMYCAWRLTRRWTRKTKVSKQRVGLPREVCVHAPKSEGGVRGVKHADIVTMEPVNVNVAQKQLIDTRDKIEDLRYQLSMLTGEKDMLAAEISMRKKMIVELQEEISIERDRRQQAELKMELMEWENNHLRSLRKDVAVKESKIDILQASLKQKEQQQDLLLKENIIVPKNVAAARAKEYENLRAMIHTYEVNSSTTRLGGSFSLLRHESRASRDALKSSCGSHKSGNNDNRHLAVQDSDAVPLKRENESYPTFPRSVITDTRNTISPWQSSPEEMYVDERDIVGDKHRRVKDRLIKSQNSEKGKNSEPITTTNQQKNKFTAKDYPQDVNKSERRNPRRNQTTSPSRVRAHGDLTETSSTSHESAVIGQFQSFLNGLNQSGSSYDLGTMIESPAQMGDALPSESRLWSEFENTANNCSQEGMKEVEADGLSISESHSSVFMSASCGSNSSDEVTKDVTSRALSASSRRGRSSKRVSSSAKGCSFKRLSIEKRSTSKRYRSQDKTQSCQGTIFPAQKRATIKQILLQNRFQPQTLADNTKSSIDEPKTLKWELIAEGNTTSSKFSQPTASNKELHCSCEAQVASEINNREQENLSHNGRARPRFRTVRLKQSIKSVLASSVTHQSENIFSVEGTPVTNQNRNDQPVIGVSVSRLSHSETSRAGYNCGDTNVNSTEGSRSDSEESWIVITPAN